jgi:dephospho-CoA kinase
MTRPVIGLIGAIGAGKSAAAKLLAERGGLVIDADKLGHAAINTPEVLAKLVERWGRGMVNADGSANRRAVAGIVFRDAAELKWLESQLFPLIGAMAIGQIRTATAPFIVVDAAMLIEAGWRRICDRVIYLDAPRAVRVERVAGRGWSEHDLAAREASQLPAEAKIAEADAAVMNDGTVAELKGKLDRLLDQWTIG